MKATVFKNLWSRDQLEFLQHHFNNLPFSNTQIYNGVLWCKDKHLDYHIPGSPAYKIIRPKIQEIFGDHEMSNGSYKESHFPYAAHVDGDKPGFRENSLSDRSQHFMAVLIPLSENEHFNTVTWNCFDRDYDDIDIAFRPEWLTMENQIDENLFTHMQADIRKDVSRLPLDQIFNWKLGDCFVWPRDQLHASTDFAKFGLIKKFIILFLA